MGNLDFRTRMLIISACASMRLNYLPLSFVNSTVDIRNRSDCTYYFYHFNGIQIDVFIYEHAAKLLASTKHRGYYWFSIKDDLLLLESQSD